MAGLLETWGSELVKLRRRKTNFIPAKSVEEESSMVKEEATAAAVTRRMIRKKSSRNSAFLALSWQMDADSSYSGTTGDGMSIEDPLNPYYLHHSQSPGVALQSQILMGDNYQSWNRAMLIVLSAKNKKMFMWGCKTACGIPSRLVCYESAYGT